MHVVRANDSPTTDAARGTVPPANDASHGITRKTKNITKIQISTSRLFALGNTSEVDKRKCH
jgi:hypothetical protein